MDSVRKRLLDAIKDGGFDLKDLSLRIGRNHAYLQQFINRETPRHLNEIDRKKLAAILKLSELELGAPDMRVNTLELNRQRSQNLVSSFEPDVWEGEGTTQSEETAAYSREHWVPSIEGAIPELDVKLGAGEGTVGEIITLSVGDERLSGHKVVAEWLVPENYLIHEAKANGQSTIVMEVVGDSMHPTYMPGDRVLIDLNQTKLVADTVYAISDGYGEPQIKRLQRVPFSKPPQVRIISDNPSLETFTVELAWLTIIGRVCGHIARR